MRRLGPAHEEGFCHTDRRKPEPHSGVTCHSEERGMETPVAVHEQYVRRASEAPEGRSDCREFSIRKICRDVGEVDPHDSLHDFNGRETADLAPNADDVRFTVAIGRVHASDCAHRSHLVLFDDGLGESCLLILQSTKQGV